MRSQAGAQPFGVRTQWEAERRRERQEAAAAAKVRQEEHEVAELQAATQLTAQAAALTRGCAPPSYGARSPAAGQPRA